MPIPVVISMRFSYWGKSGWKSDASQQKELLFDRARLEGRLDLLRKVALPSLAAQSDPDFHLFVLTSEDLPDWAAEELRDAVVDALGEDQATIVFAGYAAARKYHRQFLTARHGTGVVAQVVLDDDDGLSSDFVADLKAKVAELDANGELSDEGLPHFISYPRGYGLVSGAGGPQVYSHSYTFINLGLTMIERGSHKSIFAINHRKAPARNAHSIFPEAHMFVRSVHDHNDSRVKVTGRWNEVANWRDHDDIRDRFPFLRDL